MFLATFFNLGVALRSLLCSCKMNGKKLRIHFNGLPHTFFDSSSHSVDVVAVVVVAIAVDGVAVAVAVVDVAVAVAVFAVVVNEAEIL